MSAAYFQEHYPNQFVPWRPGELVIAPPGYGTEPANILEVLLVAAADVAILNAMVTGDKQ